MRNLTCMTTCKSLCDLSDAATTHDGCLDIFIAVVVFFCPFLSGRVTRTAHSDIMFRQYFTNTFQRHRNVKQTAAFVIFCPVLDVKYISFCSQCHRVVIFGKLHKKTHLNYGHKTKRRTKTVYKLLVLLEKFYIVHIKNTLLISIPVTDHMSSCSRFVCGSSRADSCRA